MRDIFSLKAEAILAIPADEPERLFPKDAEALKKTFRKLAMNWHPDRCAESSAAAVFAHLEALRARGEEKLREGTWQIPGLLELKTLGGRSFELRYGQRDAFELGTCYASTTTLTYVVDKQYADLFKAGVATIKSLKFANADMKKQLGRCLPTIKAELETKDAHVLVLEKPADMLRLRDVMGQSGGKMDPKHVAWVVSELYNTACYLRYAGLTHNDFSLDTVFISPEHHGAAVLGGWWYATAFDKKLTALPTRTIERAPSDVLRSQKADARIDLELIRAIGRELLGDPLGNNLSWSKEVPKAMANWLRAPASADARAEYKAWYGHVLPGSFGPRRFVKWDKPLSNPYEPRRI